MNINTINPLVLAYIGDAIIELIIRNKLIMSKINKVNDLQKSAIKYVSAKGEDSFITYLIDNNKLNDIELDIYKRARNTKVASHPKSVSILTYKSATGCEAVFGYLYLTNQKERINELISMWEELC